MGEVIVGANGVSFVEIFSERNLLYYDVDHTVKADIIVYCVGNEDIYVVSVKYLNTVAKQQYVNYLAEEPNNIVIDQEHFYYEFDPNDLPEEAFIHIQGERVTL